MSAPNWRPRLVALDIDGTLLKWVTGPGGGSTHEAVPPAVLASVRRAVDAGAHVVLASGRAPHGMTVVAEQLQLRDPADPDGDGLLNTRDISVLLNAWLATVQAGTRGGDFSGDGLVNSGDISAFLTAWLDAVQWGC